MIKNLMERKAQEEAGFTLVELLVVILIIGILAAVAIPAFLGQRQRANDASVESDVKNLATQIESALIGDPNASSITGNGGPAGSVTITVGSEEATATLSDGVSVSVTGDADGYTINGWHSNGKNYTSSSAALVYDSANGGLARDGGDGSED